MRISTMGVVHNS